MRGIIYTAVALMLFSLLVILASSQSAFLTQTQEHLVNKLLSDQLGRFEATVERDLTKAVDVSASRALVSAVNYVIINGTPLDNSPNRLNELMVNGTLYGQPQTLMENNTLNYWLGRMQAEGNAVGLIVQINFTGLTVYLNDSFSMGYSVGVNISVSDSLGRSKITKSISRIVYRSIESIEDPIYPLNTGALVKRIISKAPANYSALMLVSGSSASGNVTAIAVRANASDTSYIVSIPNKSTKILVVDNSTLVGGTISSFAGTVSECACAPTVAIPYVIGAASARTLIAENETIYLDSTTTRVWDLKRLEDTVTYRRYVSSPNGPSLLDRLEGRLNNSYGNGIESFVSLPDLSDAGVTIKSGKTLTDYLYFDNSTHTGYTVRGFFYSWFLVDKESDGSVLHDVKYGVTNSSSTLTQ